MIKGFGLEGVEPLLPWFLFALVAMLAFKYAFFWSVRRDQDTISSDSSRKD